MKHFSCRSLGNDCDFEVHADVVDDMVQQIITHLHEVHHLKIMNDDAAQEARIRAACDDALVNEPC